MLVSGNELIRRMISMSRGRRSPGAVLAISIPETLSHSFRVQISFSNERREADYHLAVLQKSKYSSERTFKIAGRR